MYIRRYTYTYIHPTVVWICGTLFQTIKNKIRALLHVGLFCRNDELLCENIWLWCGDVELLCENMGLFCGHVGLFIRNAGLLCGNIGLVC